MTWPTLGPLSNHDYTTWMVITDIRQNRMTVTECNIGNRALAAADAETEIQTQALPLATASASFVPAALCNGAEFDAASMSKPIEERLVHGDATDQAIIRFSERLDPVSHIRQCWQTKYELAFNSKNKYMIKALVLFTPRWNP